MAKFVCGESQKPLRAASILLIKLNGYTAEVAKSIILAGVKFVTFLDHQDATAQDLCAQFLIPKDQIGNNRAEASLQRAQELNLMVEIIMSIKKMWIQNLKSTSKMLI